MINRFRSYLDKQFSGYPKTQQLIDFKEELVGVLMDKFAEAVAKGKGELDAYTFAIESLGDLRSTYKDEMHALDATLGEKARSSAMFLLGTAAYFLTLTVVFLGLHFGKVQGPIWILWPLGALAYAAFTMLLIHRSGKLAKKQVISRGALYMFIYIVTVAVFLSLSFALNGKQLSIVSGANFSIWAVSWILFLLATAAVHIIIFVNAKKKAADKEKTTTFKALNRAKLVAIVNIAAAVFETVLAAYLFVSLTGLVSWAYSWLILLVTIIVGIVVAIIKLSKKQSAQ